MNAAPTALPPATVAPTVPPTSEERPATEPPPVAAPPMVEPPPEPAAPLAPAPQLPLKLGGSFWTRYELRSGYAEHGLTHPRLHREGDYLVSRARLVVSTTPVDLGNGMSASATFAPQAAYTMGEVGAADTVGDHPGIVLYEGFARVGGANGHVDAGRFMMDYGDALVIGNLGWNESARAFNGARLHLAPAGSAYYVDVFGTLISEGRLITQEPIQGDRYFWGIYAGLGPAISEGLELDIYFLGDSVARNEDVTLTDPTDSTTSIVGELEPANDLTLGARVKGMLAPMDYRLEAGIQFGKSPVNPTFASPDPSARDKFAYQADAELGVAPAQGLRLAVEGLIASGDDPATTDKAEGWNQLYPTAHKFLGFADIVGGRTNIASAVLHLQYSPVEPLKLSLDAHYFSRLETPAGIDSSMGGEIDTNVLYAFGAGASVRGMYAIFLPNDDHWTSDGVDADVAGEPMHYFELQFGYDFK